MVFYHIQRPSATERDRADVNGAIGYLSRDTIRNYYNFSDAIAVATCNGGLYGSSSNLRPSTNARPLAFENVQSIVPEHSFMSFGVSYSRSTYIQSVVSM